MFSETFLPNDKFEFHLFAHQRQPESVCLVVGVFSPVKGAILGSSTTSRVQKTPLWMHTTMAEFVFYVATKPLWLKVVLKIGYTARLTGSISVHIFSPKRSVPCMNGDNMMENLWSWMLFHAFICRKASSSHTRHRHPSTPPIKDPWTRWISLKRASIENPRNVGRHWAAKTFKVLVSNLIRSTNGPLVFEN